jgi:type I restriction enzyme S subunit
MESAMPKLQKTTIGSLLNFSRGYDLPREKMKFGDIPVVGSNGIIGYHSIAKTGSPCLSIGRSGSVGFVHYTDRPCWPHNTSLFVDDFKGNNPKYLFYLLKMLNLNKLASGTGVPTLNRNHIHPIKISAVVNIASQKLIADILSSLDDKIDLNNKINAKLEVVARTLYDYWFVQFDFPDGKGRPYKSSGGKMVYNEVLKRDIPEGWETCKLGDILDLLKDGTHNPPKRVKNGIPLLTGTMFGNNFLNYSDATYISQEDYTKIHSTYCPNNKDIIMTKIGTMGKINILTKEDLPIAIHCNSAILRCKTSYSNLFLFFQLQSDEFQEHLRRYMSKTIQEFISLEKLSEVPILRAEKSITNKYVIEISPTFEKMINIRNDNLKLIQLRDFLLPMLMNGQIKIDP